MTTLSGSGSSSAGPFFSSTPSRSCPSSTSSSTSRSSLPSVREHQLTKLASKALAFDVNDTSNKVYTGTVTFCTQCALSSSINCKGIDLIVSRNRLLLEVRKTKQLISLEIDGVYKVISHKSKVEVNYQHEHDHTKEIGSLSPRELLCPIL